jgi:hypothetical protein
VDRLLPALVSAQSPGRKQNFNYILKMLYLGCQWKALPIDKDPADRHRIFRGSDDHIAGPPPFH